MGELIEMPKPEETTRDGLNRALVSFLGVATGALFMVTIPVVVWLWTVAL